MGRRDFMSWGATDVVLTEQWQCSGLRRFVTKVSACLWRQKLEANQQPYTATEARCNWMTCSLSLPVLDLFGFWKPEKEEVVPPHIILWLNVGLVYYEDTVSQILKLNANCDATLGWYFFFYFYFSFPAFPFLSTLTIVYWLVVDCLFFVSLSYTW